MQIDDFEKKGWSLVGSRDRDRGLGGATMAITPAQRSLKMVGEQPQQRYLDGRFRLTASGAVPLIFPPGARAGMVVSLRMGMAAVGSLRPSISVSV
jgi:hypothetical protein